MEEKTISAGSNPALANNLIQQALKEPETTVEKAEIKEPRDTSVELPGGYVTSAGEVLRLAEVRELNGRDEEAIMKYDNVFKAMNTILSRGVVSIGNQPVDDEILDSILSADRDTLLLAIFRATFGNSAVIPSFCAGCTAVKEVEVDVTKDIKHKVLVDPLEDRSFTVTTKSHEYVVTLPTGKAQRELMTSGDKNTAELTTLFLEYCVKSIDGRPVFDKSQIQAIGIADRRKITTEIETRNPGPQFNEVAVDCPDCGGKVGVPLNFGTLFQFECSSLQITCRRDIRIVCWLSWMVIR